MREPDIRGKMAMFLRGRNPGWSNHRINSTAEAIAQHHDCEANTP